MSSSSSNADIPLCHLPLRPSTMQLFQKRGFASTKEIEEAKASGGMANLAAELGLTLVQAASLYREIQGCCRTSASPSSSTTSRHGIPANHLLKNTNNNDSIITFCRAVDQMLGGGIALGQLTELAGEPGSGKTQLAMQLAVNACLPTLYGGVAGETIYIDTEGSFAPERCWRMAVALVQHIYAGRRRRGRSHQEQAAQEPPDWFTPENILKSIHVYRVHDQAAQTAVLYSLPQLLQQQQQQSLEQQRHRRPNKLVIVDSMAFLYRSTFADQDFGNRARSLTQQAALLSELAHQHDVAVVAVNQMTTKLLVGSSSRLVPALGESWAHAVTTRLLLSTPPPPQQQQQSQRRTTTCHLTKSPCLPTGSADFCIVPDGIRGVEYVVREETTNDDVSSNSKRPRTGGVTN